MNTYISRIASILQIETREDATVHEPEILSNYSLSTLQTKYIVNYVRGVARGSTFGPIMLAVCSPCRVEKYFAKRCPASQLLDDSFLCPKNPEPKSIQGMSGTPYYKDSIDLLQDIHE